MEREDENCTPPCHEHNLISIEKYNFNLIQICVTFGNNPDYELSLKHTAKYIYFNIRE